MTRALRWGPLALLALASCYSFIGRYEIKTTAQAPFVDKEGTRYWYVDIAALSGPKTGQDPPPGQDQDAAKSFRRESYVDGLFRCAPPAPAIADRRTLAPTDRPGQPRPVALDDASAGELVFRVGLVSDVHIRQSAVKLFSDDVSRSLDHVIDSFERNGYQEAFQNAVYAATVAAFNQLADVADKPRLLINTGDATDAGTVQEAYDFTAISRYLRYPVLYALGNHDDAIFGNYKARLGYTKEAGPTFYPVGAKGRFLLFFNQTPRRIAGFRDELVPLPSTSFDSEVNARWGALDFPRETVAGAEPRPTTRPDDPSVICKKGSGLCQQRSFCGGFDLGGGRDLRGRCEEAVGYYAVTLTGGGGTTVQLIGLNTTAETKWGQWADFPDDERRWLDEQLARDADVTILFMHHPPADLPALRSRLQEAAKQRPLVTLSAHAHSHHTTWEDGFWDINTGSLEEFPQWSRLVEIRRAGNGRLYLNARVLRPNLPILATPPDVTAYGVPAGLGVESWDQLSPEVREQVRPWVEAQLAACDKIAALPDVPCDHGTGSYLVDSAQCGYLGALYDHTLRKGRDGQLGITAWGQASVILDVSP
jgi:hypothetical protein